MTTTPLAPRAFHPRSVSALSFWAKTMDEREETFRELRDHAPVSWQPPMEGSMMPPQNDGLWVVTRHEHIVEVSRDADRFSSGQGVLFEEVPEELQEAASSFLAMDAPRHLALRRLVSSAFTPKQVRRMDDQIRGQAAAIVDGLLEARSGDFVDLVAKRLPMWTINELIGLDGDVREEARRHADEIVAWNDTEVAAGREPAQVFSDALVSLLAIALDFSEFRRAHPGDDLMTNLVNAEIDGQRLTDDEIAAFFVLLSVAGNDTTRNTISHTVRAFQAFPDQRAVLLEDFEGRIPAAIEEFVRWSTPVMTFRRTATRDCVLGGQEIRAGDWVALMYSSGNRDERAFATPHTFDVTRSLNPHVGFGGGGPHFCLGAFIAKRQLREMFDQLLHRAPGLEVGEPEYLVGNFVHAIKRMPCALR